MDGLGCTREACLCHPEPVPRLQILLLAFLKLIDEGSHMVMLECPETVNTLLHEFLLWEPEPSPKALPEPLPAPPEEKK